MKKITFKHILIAIPVALTIIVACYFGNYYHANDYAKSQVGEINDGYMTFSVSADSSNNIGFIFYPGAKVEYTAYSPILNTLSQSGITCYLVNMPLNFAIFNIDAAKDIMAEHPEIDSWYIGGHSLGGAMAANYCVANIDQFDGLILCASTCTNDITASDLAVLNIYGSNDTVLSDKAKNNNIVNLPSDTQTVIIDGGNHAYFGSYGEQKGDGIATITAEKQQEITSEAIQSLIFENH